MPFEPGTPKPPTSGRKKGALNRCDAIIRDGLADVTLKLMKNANYIADSWVKGGVHPLDEKRALTLLVKLLDHTLPRRLPVVGGIEETDDDAPKTKA